MEIKITETAITRGKKEAAATGKRIRLADLEEPGPAWCTDRMGRGNNPLPICDQIRRA
jgi:hypothetical protein